MGANLVSVPQMDLEHLALIAQVNEFSAAVDRGPPRPTRFARLALIAAVRNHFDSEEGLMRSSGYPAIKAHEEEHRKLIAQMTGLRDDLCAGTVSACHTLVLFVRAWTEQHITGMDRSFQHFLERRIRIADWSRIRQTASFTGAQTYSPCRALYRSP